MGPNGTTSAGNGSAGDAGPRSAVLGEAVDRFLNDMGRRLPPSELREVARHLEQLESSVVASERSRREAYISLNGHLPVAAPPSMVYNGASGLRAAMTAALSDLSLPDQFRTDRVSTVRRLPPRDQVDSLPSSPAPSAAAWGAVELPVAALPPHAAGRPSVQTEDVIQLQQLLVRCAEHVQQDEAAASLALIVEMQQMLARVGTRSGIGKAIAHFVDALHQRICDPPGPETENLVEGWTYHFYDYYYEACPYLKYAHAAANETILDAVTGYDRVHIVDLNLMHGHQWAALIQALAVRPGSPPSVRITGISALSPDEGGRPRVVRQRLIQLARSVGVELDLRCMVTNKVEQYVGRLADAWAGEALVVNSEMQLHRLLGDRDEADQPVDSLLRCIRRASPVILTVVEQEANHNFPGLGSRVGEALSYYSSVFDSLMEERHPPHTGLAFAAEAYLRTEICNIVCCEDGAWVERPEPMARWRWRMSQAGFHPAPMGSDAFEHGRRVLLPYSANGYTMSNVGQYLTLEWRNRPIISISAWKTTSSSTSTFP